MKKKDHKKLRPLPKADIISLLAPTEEPVETRKNPYSGNPKDILSTNKVPLHLVPDSMRYMAALSFAEGALKYGQYNWRAKPVHMSVYIAALERHTACLNSGQWADEHTNVPHIASVLACAAIIADAFLEGSLVMDRPPLANGLLRFMKEIPTVTEHLQEIFSHHRPHQYTENDVIGKDGVGNP